MSIDAWSDFAGATQSRIVDLIVNNLFNVCAVAGAVVMYVAADSAVFWLGAALGVASVIMLGWLLRRDISRGRALLATYKAARMIVLLAVAAGYLARRPDDAGLDLDSDWPRNPRDPLRADPPAAVDQGGTGGGASARFC